MTVPGKNTFKLFNFVLHLWDSGDHGPHAGFQECSGAGVDFAIDECRRGNKTGDTTCQIMGMHRFGSLTLKRGVVSAPDFNQWLEDIRQSNQGALRNVTLRLQNAERTEAVQAWRLVHARIIKHVSGPLNAQGTDVPMEELTLAYERLEMQ
jgi:phage tail-like protein